MVHFCASNNMVLCVKEREVVEGKRETEQDEETREKLRKTKNR
jgi:hypothetical protein